MIDYQRKSKICKKKNLNIRLLVHEWSCEPIFLHKFFISIRMAFFLDIKSHRNVNGEIFWGWAREMSLEGGIGGENFDGHDFWQFSDTF